MRESGISVEYEQEKPTTPVSEWQASQKEATTFNSKAMNAILVPTFWHHICTFLDPLKHKLINLVIYPSDFLGKLFKSRLTQVNHIK